MYHKTKRYFAIVSLPQKEKYKFFRGCLPVLQLKSCRKIIIYLLIPIVPEECILNGIVEIASLDHGVISTLVTEASRCRC